MWCVWTVPAVVVAAVVEDCSVVDVAASGSFAPSVRPPSVSAVVVGGE